MVKCLGIFIGGVAEWDTYKLLYMYPRAEAKCGQARSHEPPM